MVRFKLIGLICMIMYFIFVKETQGYNDLKLLEKYIQFSKMHLTDVMNYPVIFFKFININIFIFHNIFQ